MLSACRADRSLDSFVGIAIQNVASTILALGVGGEKLFKSLTRNFPATINIAAAKLQIELMPVSLYATANSIFDFTGIHFTILISPTILAGRPIESQRYGSGDSRPLTGRFSV